MTAEPLDRPRQWAALAGFGVAVLAAALVGGLAAAGAGEQYADLAQPSWAPPAWVFGPVWTALYVMIALSGWVAWRKPSQDSGALAVYGAQLVLNALWTPLFFAWGLLGLAFVDIVLLWVLVGVTFWLFARISKTAAWLLAPYWAWVGFASALNYAIWQLN